MCEPDLTSASGRPLAPPRRSALVLLPPLRLLPLDFTQQRATLAFFHRRRQRGLVCGVFLAIDLFERLPDGLGLHALGADLFLLRTGLTDHVVGRLNATTLAYPARAWLGEWLVLAIALPPLYLLVTRGAQALVRHGQDLGSLLLLGDRDGELDA